ncbi:MAG: hypothetical protein II144_04970 [Paludibacteraceae bacterium]|nr:hypothetical protein [Paludibacteraceae bacterium]MBQ2608583.1 hypothetical protein [Paludibacteraceae bacterium]
MKKYSFLLIATVLCACGGPTTQTGEQVNEDTIPAPTNVVVREMASPDMVAFGTIRYGRVRSITTDDFLAENPVMSFDEEGHMVPNQPSEVVIRDKQGRPANYNGGVMDKDTVGFLFRSTLQYEEDETRVKAILSDNTANKTQSKTYRRFYYDEQKVYPATSFELHLSGKWPAANYTIYTYTRLDEEDNWLEREVKNYYFERPDFLLPDVMNQVNKEDVMQATRDLLIEHLADAVETSYTESRTIVYYE